MNDLKMEYEYYEWFEWFEDGVWMILMDISIFWRWITNIMNDLNDLKMEYDHDDNGGMDDMIEKIENDNG